MRIRSAPAKRGARVRATSEEVFDHPFVLRTRVDAWARRPPGWAVHAPHRRRACASRRRASHGRGRIADVRRGEPLRAGVLARKRGIRRAGWALGVRRKVLGVPPRRGVEPVDLVPPAPGFRAPAGGSIGANQLSREANPEVSVSSPRPSSFAAAWTAALHAREPRDDRGERVRHAHVAHLGVMEKIR